MTPVSIMGIINGIIRSGFFSGFLLLYANYRIKLVVSSVFSLHSADRGQYDTNGIILTAGY